ncbi:MAG: hypothetical protein KDA57_01635 [Planctomycetales bacterium]|nr:hypothetical protein [Planctomycetales bacterium]
MTEPLKEAQRAVTPRWPLIVAHCLVVLSLTLAWAPVTFGIEAASLKHAAEANHANGFRRVFVPADEPEEWPIGEEHYLPISKAEFQRLIEQLELRLANNGIARARLTGGVYHAELLEDQLLVGHAVLEVQNSSDEPQLLPLSPLNVSVSTASWNHNAAEQAEMGIWQLADDQQVQGVLVDHTGSLQIDWQLRASAWNSSSTEFALELPVAVPQTLAIVVPASHTVVVKSGELFRTDELPEGTARWWFHLSPTPAHQIRILRQSESTSKRILPQASRSTTYRFDRGGLSLETSLRLDSHEAPVGDLAFALSGGLKVVSVAIDESAASWRIDESPNGTRLIIERTPSRESLAVEVRAIAQHQYDQPWQLPAIRPQEVSWSEGSIRLSIPPDLELCSLVPRQASLLRIDGLYGSPALEEIYDVQEWSSDASLEVVLSQREQQLTIRSGTTIAVDPEDSELGGSDANESTGLTAVELTSLGRDVYQLELDVSPHWTIESVKATPPSALSDWHLLEERGRRTMRIQLSEPVRLANPLKLEIASRAAKPGPLLPTSAGKLSPLRFLNGRYARRLLLLKSRQRGQLELIRGLDHLHVAAEAIDAGDLQILPESGDGVLLDLTHLSEEEPIELLARSDRYHAVVNAEIEMLADSFNQRYQLDCSPISGVVSEVVVQFDEPLPDTVQWNLVGRRGGVVATRMDSRDSDESTPSKGTVYRLQLPIALDGPFSLEAEHSSSNGNSLSCNLPSLPEASDWRGQVIVRGPLEGTRIDDRNWTPIAYQEVAGEESDAPERPFLPVLGCYRLESDQSQRATLTERLVVSRIIPKPSESSLFAWMADFQSYYAVDGAAIYLATYYLENSGSTGADLLLPDNSLLQEAWIDQQHFEPREVLVENQICRFHFDGNRRFLTLSVKYAVRHVPLEHQATLKPLLPECSFSADLGRLTLWTPAQYQLGLAGEEKLRLSWFERLFGPLSRSTSRLIFNPLRIDDWQPLGAPPLDSRASLQRAVRFSKSLASHLHSDASQEWGKVIQAAATSTATDHLLLIDCDALRLQGIEADVLLETESLAAQNTNARTTAFTSSRQSIQGSGLILIASPKALLLTTELRAAQWRDSLESTKTPGVYRTASDGFASRLRSSAGLNRPSLGNDLIGKASYVSLTDWLAATELNTAGWTSGTSSSLAGLGRRAATIEFLDQPPQVVVYQDSVRQAQWHVIWLLALTLGTWLLPRYGNQLVPVLLFLAATCLIVSSEWLLNVQAVFLGLLSAFLFQCFLRKMAYQSAEPQRQKLSTPQTIALTSLCVALLLCSQATADTNDKPIGHKVSGQASPLYQVLFPIDKEGIAQGEDVYVPEAFIAELKGAPRDTAHAGAHAVLTSAAYEGTLPSDRQAALSPAEVWSITLEAQSFVSESELELPFRFDEADWLEERHRLDGRPVELRWNSDGNGCRVTLHTIGPHRLELKAKPKVSAIANRINVRMHVPPLCRAAMELSVPPGIHDLRIDSAGQLQVDKATGRWQVPLLGSGILQMNWDSAQVNTALEQIGQVEQLAWLHISPTEARLDVQLRLELAGEVPKQLVLETSPPMKLLPLGESSPIVAVESKSENLGLLSLDLKSDLKAPLTLQLQFQLERSHSLGHLSYPQLRVQQAIPSRSLFAVSVAQGLSYEESLIGEAANMSAEEFASQWGGSTVPPLFAYTQNQGFPSGSLRVWPDPKTISAQQNMRVHCDLGHAHLEYQAVVDQLTGSWLAHRLWIPEQFTLEDLTVTRQSDMQDIPARWSRFNRSQVMLFLGQPLDVPHIIDIKGFVEASKEGKLELPAISLSESERKELHVDLTRNADVLVSWDESIHVPTESALQVRDRTDAKIPIGRWTWRASGVKEMKSLSLQRNHLQFAADTVTTISKGTSGWNATLHSAIHVQEGVLSQVTVAVPDKFRQPYRMEPADLGVLGEVRETASGRQVTFLLSKPVPAQKSIELHITGDLDLPPNQQLEVPPLELIGSTQGEQYLLLPIEVEKQPVQWNLRGLRLKPLPERLSRIVGDRNDRQSLLVDVDGFFAQERSYQGPLRNAGLKYALISGTLDRSGRLSAVAEMVLQPGRATHCTLRLPPNAKLKQLVAGDSRVRREKLDARSWRIALGPPFLPRKVKVIYEDKVPTSGKSCQLLPPAVFIGDLPLPAPRTLWHIRPTSDLHLGEVVLGHALRPEQFARSAHQFPLETLDDSRLLAMELSPSEGKAWFRPWQQDTQLAWNQWRAIDPDATSLDEKAPTLLDSELPPEQQENTWSILSNKLGDDPQSADKSQSAVYPPSLPASATVLSSSRDAHFISDQAGELVLAIGTAGETAPWNWLLAAIIATVGIFLTRRPQTITAWQGSGRNSSHLVFLGAGLFWWLFLSPSAIGFLVVVVMLTSIAIRRRAAIVPFGRAHIAQEESLASMIR